MGTLATGWTGTQWPYSDVRCALDDSKDWLIPASTVLLTHHMLRIKSRIQSLYVPADSRSHSLQLQSDHLFPRQTGRHQWMCTSFQTLLQTPWACACKSEWVPELIGKQLQSLFYSFYIVLENTFQKVHVPRRNGRSIRRPTSPNTDNSGHPRLREGPTRDPKWSQFVRDGPRQHQARSPPPWCSSP